MVKFVVTQAHLFWWPVKVRMPNPDPRRAGQVVEFQFKVQFEDIGSAEADRINAEVAALPLQERSARQHELLLTTVKNWDSDIVDETGAPVPFSAEMLNQLLNSVWFASGVWRAWGEAQRGESGRKGN